MLLPVHPDTVMYGLLCSLPGLRSCVVPLDSRTCTVDFTSTRNTMNLLFTPIITHQQELLCTCITHLLHVSGKRNVCRLVLVTGCVSGTVTAMRLGCTGEQNTRNHSTAAQVFDHSTGCYTTVENWSDAANGTLTEQWQCMLPGPIFSSPVVMPHSGSQAAVVLAVDVHGNACHVAASSGKAQWQVSLSEQILADGVAVCCERGRMSEAAAARPTAHQAGSKTDVCQCVCWAGSDGSVMILAVGTGQVLCQVQLGHGAVAALMPVLNAAQELSNAVAEATNLQGCLVAVSSSGAVVKLTPCADLNSCAGWSAGLHVDRLCTLSHDSFSGVALCAELRLLLLGGRNDAVHAVQLSAS